MVNGDGLGGKAIEVTVSLIVSGVQELTRVNVNEILGEIKLAYWAGDGGSGSGCSIAEQRCQCTR